jgi:hypothetical protein
MSSTPTHCETLLCHNIVRSAAAYSLMAGVLASVAFLSIVFLLESQHFHAITGLLASRGTGEERLDPQTTLDRDLGNITVSLITAFLNLIIATFLYAALGGEDVLGPRAETLAFIAAISISIGFLNLLYGIVWLLETRDLALPAAVARAIAALIAPAVTFAFIGIRAVDMRSLAEGHRATKSWLGLLLLCLLGTLIVIFFVSNHLKKSRVRVYSLTSDRAVRLTTYSALAIGVLTVPATAIVSELPVSYAVPRWGVAVVMTALFLAQGAYITLVGAVEEQK